MPKLSVCIPTFNTARYLPQTIESVLSQEFTDYELLICDDASTDDTPSLIAQYSEPRLRYFRSEQRQGQAGAWNWCITLSKGDYVALLHADDCYLPGFLAERVSMLDSQPHVGLAFGAVLLIDETGAATGTRSFSKTDLVLSAPEFLQHLLLDCVIFPPSVVVRRVCYDVIGRFNGERFWGIDWEFWLRLSVRYGVAYSSRVTSAYRIHDNSATPIALSTARNARDGFDVLTQIFREVASSSELARYMSLRSPAFHAFAMRTLSAGAYMCDRGNLPSLRKHLHFALRADPKLLSRPTVWALLLSSCLGPWVYRTFRKMRSL